MGGAATVGRLVVTVSGDVDQLKIDMREAQAITGAATKEIVNGLQGVTDATYTRNAAGQRMVAAMREEIATFGMSSDELKIYKASLLGVEDEVSRLIEKTNAMKSAQSAFTQESAAVSNAFKGHGAAASEAGGHVEQFGFKTAGAKRELLVLAHELSQGNYKKFGGSMLVIGEQTGAASLLFSAAGISVIAMGAAIIGTAIAIEKGAAEQRAMNNALIMTGNYAGQTSDSLNALAHAAVESGGSLGEAKKVVTQLAESGKFTGDQLGTITGAVVALEHATGASVEETIKQFESLSVQAQGHSARASTAISQATVKLDEQYHFLTLSVYDQITALEKEGDLKGASKIATEEFARVTKERAEQIIGNLGNVAVAWHKIKEEIGKAIDYVGEWGKKSTAAIEVARLQKEIASPYEISGVYNKESADAAVAADKLLLVAAQAALNKENKIASGQAAETMAQSNAVQAAQRIDAMLLRAQSKEQGALTTALKEYHESLDRLRAGSTTEDIDPRLTDKAIKDGEAALTKLHSQALKGNDDRAARLQDALTLEQTALDREKAIYDSRGKMLDLYHKSFGMADADFYAGEETRRAEYIAAEAIAFAKESSLINGSQAKNPEEIAARKQKYDALLKQHLEFVDKMNASAGQDGVAALAAVEKQYQDIVKAIQEAGAAEDKRLTDAIDKQKLHNAEIGKSKEQIELAKRAAEDLGTAQMQSDADFIRDGLTKWDLDAQSLAAYTMRLSLLDGEIVKRKELSGLLTVGAGLEAGVANAAASKKLADMAIQDWQRAGSSIADSLSKAFGSGGKALGEMFKAYAQNSANQMRLDKEMALAKAKLDTDPTKLREIDSIQRQSAQAQLKSYADMADAAQGFFDAGSRGYAAMGAAAQVMHAAEVALSLVKGVNAVLTQGGGDPYTAFGRMAAMAAIVTGLGVALSGGGGSGGGESAANVQKTQGTGSFYEKDGKLNTSNLTGGVFGDSIAKSESIARAISLSSANSSIEITHTAGMLAALKNIEASMSGLTNLIVRTPGVTDASNMGIQTGTISKSTGASIVSGAGIGAAAGSYFGPIGTAVGAVLGGIVGGLKSIWGKTTQDIVDSGLQFGGSVRGLQSGQGYNQYASVDTTKSSWFGLSKSTTNSVQTQGIGNELSSQFGLIFTNLEGALKTAAVAVGGCADDVSEALDSLTIDTTKVSLKGLTGDALTAAINGVISKTMDQMAEAAFPAFDQFRKVGEGYAETVIRVATNYANLDSILQSSGMTFGAVGIASLAAREHLIDLAGGIDKLADRGNFFNENFLTQAQRLAPVSAYVTAEMEKLGLAGIDTRDKFRDLVLGINKADPAGQQLYVTLMGLEEAFAKTHAAAEDLSKSQQQIADERKGLQDQLDQLTMSSVELLTKQRNALDESNRAMFDQIQAAQEAKDAIDKAKTSSEEAAKTAADAVAAQMTASKAAYADFGNSLVGAMNNATAAAKALRAFNDSLKLGNLSSLSKGAQYDVAKQQFMTTGDQASATAFLQASQAKGGSKIDYARDFAMVIAKNSASAAAQDAAAAAIPMMWAAFNSMNGSHASGLPYVPFNGYRAILHKDEGVLTAAENQRYRTGNAGGMSEATAQRLIAAIEAGNKHSRQTADILLRVTKNGKSLLTTAT